MMSRSPYIVLGISPSAGPEEIRAAYRRRAASVHPDKSGGSHEAFIETQAAFRSLTDPEVTQLFGADTSGAFQYALNLERLKAQRKRRRARVTRLFRD